MATSSAWAADEPPPPTTPPVTKVELRELPEVAKKGKVAVYEGEADKQGVAFFLDGLGIATPVGMMLISGDASAPMTLRVKNDLSQDWDRTVEPVQGVAETKFRTEGPAMALVSSPGDLKPYKLVIWVGPEIKTHKVFKAPFVTKAAYDKKHPGGPAAAGGGGSGGGNTAGVIAGVAIALGAIVGVLVLVRRGRKGRAS